MTYVADDNRYSVQPYRRCGRSGLELPAVSLGFWHNFGDDKPLETQRAVMRRAFDLGVTHFDLANNYGPPYGAAETNAGQILRQDFAPYRDELVISSKAGWDMWPGPYGDLGSRKYLTASLDQSLQRLGLDYVDIFYHHRPDPDTPLEETMGALDAAVRAGKALYVGVSSYSPAPHREGRRDPPRAGYSAADPPAVVLDVQPLDRARAARRAGAGRASAASRSPRSPRACSPTATSRACPPTRGPRRASPSIPPPSRRTWPRSPRSTRSPPVAARRSRSWPWPGCCGMPGSPRP